MKMSVVGFCIGFNGKFKLISSNSILQLVQHVLMSLPGLYIEKQYFIKFALHLNYQQNQRIPKVPVMYYLCQTSYVNNI